jgi:hypothetical protein
LGWDPDGWFAFLGGDHVEESSVDTSAGGQQRDAVVGAGRSGRLPVIFSTGKHDSKQLTQPSDDATVDLDDPVATAALRQPEVPKEATEGADE